MNASQIRSAVAAQIHGINVETIGKGVLNEQATYRMLTFSVALLGEIAAHLADIAANAAEQNKLFHKMHEEESKESKAA
jgi:hypothetical protein